MGTGTGRKIGKVAIENSSKYQKNEPVPVALKNSAYGI
jgi:hypothetical protein